MSGSPANVAELASRLTAPVSVSGNGAGKTSVSDKPVDDPVRYALPDSGAGYSGEVAETAPTAWQVLEAGLRHTAPIDPRLGASVADGNVSAIDRLCASVGV